MLIKVWMIERIAELERAFMRNIPLGVFVVCEVIVMAFLVQLVLIAIYKVHKDK